MAKYIDAEKVIAALTDTLQYEGMVMDELISVVANIPAADVVERKTGKWKEREVLTEKVIDEWQSARCSVCGKYHTTPYMYYFDSFSFCPNCGADMRGGNER